MYRVPSIGWVVCCIAGLWLSTQWHTATASENAAVPEGFLTWRAQRENSLRSKSGYLALAGLFWLKDGSQTFGSGANNDIVFPAGRSPERAGVVFVKAGQVTVMSADGVELTQEGQAVDDLRMVPDSAGEATRVQLGELIFWVIERSGRLGIRLRDPESHVLAAYTETTCFPYDPAWHIGARYAPFASPQAVEVPNILGTSSKSESPGKLIFTIDGVEHTLQPTSASDTSFFVIFGDRTNSHESYGGGRFLSVPRPTADKMTTIDFNRAYNPPCAYSPYTTCPMAPLENRLSVRVPAGETIQGLSKP